MSLSSGLLIWVPIIFGVLVVVLGAIFLGVLLPAARKAAAADFARQVMEAEAAEEAAATSDPPPSDGDRNP